MKTWDDVIAAACTWNDDPWRLHVTSGLFRNAVTAVELGLVTREQALIEIALALGELAQRQFDLILDDLNTRMPSGPFIVDESRGVDGDTQLSAQRVPAPDNAGRNSDAGNGAQAVRDGGDESRGSSSARQAGSEPADSHSRTTEA